MTDLHATEFPDFLLAIGVAPRALRSIYPEPFASRMGGREKRVLGDRFGLSQFGVNLTRLAPGSLSALKHAHAAQDEFIYVLEGHPTLYLDQKRIELAPGFCAGFRHASGAAHHLVNESASDVLYLEIGTRTANETVMYPDDDLRYGCVDGVSTFSHRDGRPY